MNKQTSYELFRTNKLAQDYLVFCRKIYVYRAKQRAKQKAKQKTYLVGKIAKKPVCRSVFLTIWHCILTVFLAILSTGQRLK